MVRQAATRTVGDRITYKANGQSDRARVRITSGRVAARTLYMAYADAMMHLPPAAAVLRVSQLTTSPASSVWKVLGGASLVSFYAQARGTCQGDGTEN